MKVIKEISSMQEISDYYRCIGKKVALVPTMGYLHEGHTSLMIKAKDENEIVVVSIFVNPTQFGKGEDFDKYPRDFVRDFHICEKAGVDYIFNPETDEMYKHKSYTTITVNELSDKLEGKFRPGHFTGVATVVTKLLNAVKPVNLYLGQKDAQQNVIIKKMVSDLNINTIVNICETKREDSGLAMSSRNTYLSEKEKEIASVLYFLLKECRRLILEEKLTDTQEMIERTQKIFEEKAPGFILEYFEISGAEDLEPLTDIGNYKGEILVSLSSKAGKTRLIDNIIFSNQIP